MSRIDRKSQLEAAGFEQVDTVAVAVPYQLWHATLHIEYDRKFRLAEEVTLRLIREGVTNQIQLAKLLGLEGDEAFRQILVDLLRGMYIRSRHDLLELTPLGQQAAINLTARTQRRFNDAQLLYDAYSDSLGWYGEDKLLSPDSVNIGALKALPDVIQLDNDDLASRYRDVHGLIEREGIPSDPHPDRRKDLLLIEPVWWEPVYKRADMEIWLNESLQTFDWRLLQSDLELFNETKAYKIIEAEGVRVIPVTVDAP